MNEQITSAAELDALPLTTIIRDANAMPYVRWPNTPNPEWWRPGSNVPETPRLPALALYRPDQPQRVQPSREDVARLLAHQNTDWTHGYLGADLATGETHDHGPRCANWEPYAEDADAVLALFTQQPTVAEVKAEALEEARAAHIRGAGQ